MPYAYEIQEKNEYFHFTVSGVLESTEELTHFSSAMMACARDKGYTRVLFDERATPKKMDQHDWMVFADQWVLDNPREGMKVAAVYSSADVRAFHWIETILQNRSILCKIFDDMDEAKRWLMS